MTDAREGKTPLQLFALRIDYLVPLDQIDALLTPHFDYLERFYTQGSFLLSGRQVPRTGGFILAVAASREELEAIIACDPFVIHDAARYTVLEVSPTKASPTIQSALQQLGAWA
ncbi:YciI family protein [uncultured Leifsonia sp.]|uniref:YciI family protein n=1 Tax=uncultured Leifsonia sp. TaxID=340359 RepID=UPI0025EDAC09|nr:YciI family protein [uncultured Leifsonia sp.]